MDPIPITSALKLSEPLITNLEKEIPVTLPVINN